MKIETGVLWEIEHHNIKKLAKESLLKKLDRPVLKSGVLINIKAVLQSQEQLAVIKDKGAPIDIP